MVSRVRTERNGPRALLTEYEMSARARASEMGALVRRFDGQTLARRLTPGRSTQASANCYSYELR